MIWLLLAAVVFFVVSVVIIVTDDTPRPSDCPHCTWYNPESGTRLKYQARIDHMVTYHLAKQDQDEALRFLKEYS